MRLCEEVDVCAAEYLCRTRGVDGLGLDELRQIKRDIYNGFVSASARAATKEYPTDADGFVALLLDLHAPLFAPTQLPFGGRFRLPGEPVFFGRDEREGAASEQIEPALKRLFDRVWRPHPRELPRDAFVHSGARFLHRFFLIHPFTDGNGRIARLVLQIAARSTGHLSMRPLGTYDRKGRGQRRYLQALRYADKHTGGIDAERSIAVDPYRFLGPWLDRLVEDAPQPSEAMPPEDEAEHQE